MSDRYVRIGVSLFAALYLTFFLLVGLDTMDSFYWIYRHSIQGLDKYFILSQFIYDGLELLNLSNYRLFFGMVFLIWLGQYHLCSQVDAVIGGLLFMISLYWFKGILSPGCLSMLGVMALVSYVHWKARPNLLHMLGLVLITALMKITSIALFVPVLVWWFWGRSKLLFVASAFSLCGLLGLYMLSPTAQQHISLNIILNQYVLQGVLVLVSGLIIFALFDLRIPRTLRHLLIVTSVLGLTYSMAHRMLFAVVFGGVLGGLLWHNRQRWSSEFFRKFVFVVLSVVLNFLGSDTGIYKASMMLPLLAFIGVPSVNRGKFSLLLLCLALPLLILKPIRFNPGGYEIGAVLIKSCWDTDYRDDYEWLNISGHGDFLVMSWLSHSISRTDFLVDSLGAENVTFKGPHSTFFNSRYGKRIHPSYQGPLETDISTAYVFGRGVTESRYRIVEEVHPGFILYDLQSVVGR